MTFAEEHFAGAKIAEVHHFCELVPAALGETTREAVARPDHHDPIAQAGRNLVIDVVCVLVNPAFGLAFDRHQHDCVASEREGKFVRRVVGHAAVAVTLAADARRARVKRREVVRGEEHVHVVRADDRVRAVAQPRQRHVDRQCAGRRERVADEAGEIAAVHRGVAPRRELGEEIAQVDVRHAHERLPEKAHPMLAPRGDDRGVPRAAGDADADRRADAEGVQALDHADLERAAGGAAGEDVGDILGVAKRLQHARDY